MVVCLFFGGQARAFSVERVSPGFPDIQLPKKVRGEAAISSLGNRLGAIAARYGKTDLELKDLLRRDHSLWVDTRGRLFYICEFTVPEAAVDQEASGVSAIATNVDRSSTFLLHSRPGATKVIFLDFDGHDGSASSWGSDAISKPFDLDGNLSNFSATERDRIQYIWQRVSEDYSMFDIDVTTEDPGIEALRKSSSADVAYGIRVVIGGASGDWYGSAGGVAYVGSFDDNYDTPCWIFPGSLGSGNEKYVAEAVSHEAGHTLGLSHDGKTDGTEYYSGHGNWAPIMGVGYYEAISQWSKGEYALANNTEDDLAKMLTYGPTYRTDDYGNSILSAALLPGISFRAEGVIERRTDLDFFRFQTGAGKVELTATPAPRAPNLRILLSLYDSAGNLIIATNSADTTAGVLPTTIATVLPTGTYYFSVDGIGSGDPLTDGYSDYASLGQYIVTGILPSDTSWIPTAPGTNFSWINTVNWISNTVPDSADITARLNNNIVGDQIINLDKAITIGSLVLGDTNGTHSFTVQNGSAGSLTFRSTTGAASLTKKTGLNDVVASTVSLASDLAVTNSSVGNLTISGAISGAASLTKNGAGNLILEATNSYSGATTVAAGKLVLDATGSISNSPQIRVFSGGQFDVAAVPQWTLQSNQFLSGSGVILGNITAVRGARLAPGDSAAGTLSMSNNLTLNDGALINFNLADSAGEGGGTNDLLVVGGDLTLSGIVTVNLSFLNNFPASPATYTLIRYGGALSGGAVNFSVANLSSRFTFSWDDSVPGEIRLNISGAPRGVTWQGDAAMNRWDLTSANWRDMIMPTPFYQLDSVTFDDTGSETPAVNLMTNLSPASVVVNSSKNYTFSGAGKLVGTMGLTKQGSGTLTINTSNDFTGPIALLAGTLKAGNASALGSAAAGTTIASGARLEINAQNLGSEPLVVEGSGLSGTGAIINSGTAQTNALRFVTLSANTTIGGSGRWDVRANPTATFAGNNFALTKSGANDIWLVNVGGTGLGDINVNQGLLGFHGTSTAGNTLNTLTAASGAKIGIWNTDGNVLNKNWILNGAILQSLSGDNAIAGAMILTGSNTISSTSILDVQSAISGAGSLTKTGTGTLALSGANSFTGNLLVNAGILMPQNTAALGSTNGTTIIGSGARLDVNGLNLGAETIIVQGLGLGNAGAIVNGGASQLNAFRFVTLSNNTTFGGINRWDIRANPTGSLMGNNFALTKTAGNTIYLVDLGSSGLGAININEGTLGFQGTTTMGNPASTISVASGSTLSLSATGTNVLSKTMTMSTGRISNASGVNTFAGATSLTGSNTFDISSATTLSMNGAISGSGSLWKLTTGTLIFNGTNSYTGGTVISAGTLQIGSGGFSGTLGSGNVTNNGTLVFNRTNDFSVTNIFTGTGGITQNGTGAVTLSGNNSHAGSTVVNLGTLAVGSDKALGSGVLNFNGNNGSFRSANASTRTLTNELIIGGSTATFGTSTTGDLVFSGAGVNNGTLTKTLIISNANTTINNAITNRGALFKSGPGALVLAGNNTHTNTTTVLAGTLRIDAEMRLGANPAAFNSAQLTLNGGALQTTATFTISNANRGITLGAGGGTFNVNPATTLTVERPITGSGFMTKTGSGTLISTVTNSFQGPLFITNGTFALSESGGIGSVPLIDVGLGTIFDVSAQPAFSTGAGQTLSGLGTVNGTAQINGTISPSGSAGRLTFNNSLLVRGTTLMNLSKTGSTRTNDFLSVADSLSLGGSLAVTASGDALSAGDSFQLFNAPSVSGSFDNVNLPTLAAGLKWDTTSLAVNGTLNIVALTSPTLSAALSESNLLLSVQSETGISYILQGTVDLTPPVAWNNLSTNSGTGGTLTIPIPIDVTNQHNFFRLFLQ
ncbi:MAG: autotransporter-associated beta strand repeat-containing protein [Verrucomicrobiota bacterium]